MLTKKHHNVNVPLQLNLFICCLFIYKEHLGQSCQAFSMLRLGTRTVSLSPPSTGVGESYGKLRCNVGRDYINVWVAGGIAH